MNPAFITPEALAECRQKCLEMGYFCGLKTVGEAMLNTDRSLGQVFKYEEVPDRSGQLVRAFHGIDIHDQICDHLTEECRNKIDSEIIFMHIKPDNPESVEMPMESFTFKPGLPEPYVDCLILTNENVVRIARLNHKKTHWQLASYGAVKHQYLLRLKDVKDWKLIDTRF